MGVYLGGVDGRVTEQVLNYAQVGAALQEVGGEGVSQGVRRDGLINAGLEGVFHDDAVHRAGRKPGCLAAHEERVLGLRVATLCQFGPVLGQIFLQSVMGALVQ